MTEEQARSDAEALALAMGITFYVVRNREGRLSSVQLPPEDCEIVATIQPLSRNELRIENIGTKATRSVRRTVQRSPEGNVNTVLIRLRSDGLRAEMVRMREWLDEHKSEPVRFIYNQYGDTLTVAVDFDNDKEAQVFENHFCAQEAVSSIAGEISSAPEHRREGTMARAC
jgi:hypothetical protein